MHLTLFVIFGSYFRFHQNIYLVECDFKIGLNTYGRSGYTVCVCVFAQMNPDIKC